MKIKLLTIFLLLVTSQVFSKEKCKGTDVSKWDNCIGKVSFLNAEYVGEFKNGQAHGNGIATHKDGGEYVGEFKNEQADGYGTQTYPNGDKYVGGWKDAEYYGYGTYTWASSGDKYEGEWKDNKEHGQGTYTYANGNKLVGEWNEGTHIISGKVYYKRIGNMYGYEESLFGLIVTSRKIAGFYESGYRRSLREIFSEKDIHEVKDSKKPNVYSCFQYLHGKPGWYPSLQSVYQFFKRQHIKYFTDDGFYYTSKEDGKLKRFFPTRTNFDCSKLEGNSVMKE